MNKAVLVTLADQNFINQAKQLFSSAYFDGGWDGDYLLLAVNIDEQDLNWFREKGILVKKCHPTDFASQKTIGHDIHKWPNTVLAKFYLFTLEFKKWDNIVFIDSDAIITASLSDLAQVNGFWAVPDFFPQLKIRFFGKRNAMQLLAKDYNIKRRALNSGVMAFNSSIIKNDSFQKLLGLWKQYGDMSYGDEPIFNLFLIKQWKALSVIYNAPVPYWMKYYKIPMEDVGGAVLHFIGQNDEIYKPWHPKNHFYSLWQKNLDKAGDIDLESPHRAQNIYSSSDIRSFEAKLKKIRFPRRNFSPDIPIGRCLDRGLGIAGIIIRKLSPTVYYKLKKHFG